MATTISKTIIWISENTAETLPLTKRFEPVYDWDSDSRSFTANQAKLDGVPVWEAEALMKMGWGANLAPVKVRMASPTIPTVTANPQALMELFAGSDFFEAGDAR